MKTLGQFLKKRIVLVVEVIFWLSFFVIAISRELNGF